LPSCRQILDALGEVPFSDPTPIGANGVLIVAPSALKVDKPAVYFLQVGTYAEW